MRINSLLEEIHGELVLGIIPTLALYFISLVINGLKKTYPGLKLTVEELITEEIIHKIRTGNMDSGIISTPLDAGKLTFSTMFYEKFYLYVSDNHPLFSKDVVSLDDFDMKDVWYLKEGNCFTDQVNSICNLSGKRLGDQALAYKSNSVESLRRIVQSRNGITFIPELATLGISSDQEEMIKEIEGKGYYREISMVYTSLYRKKRLLDAFIEATVGQLPAHMRKEPEGMVIRTDLKIKY